MERQSETFGEKLTAAITDIDSSLNDLRIGLGRAASLQQLEEAVIDLQQEAEERLDLGEVAIELKHVRDELGEMRDQWMRLGGHMNPQQRIQHVADIKMENNQLRDELMYTRKQLRRQDKTQGSPRRTPNVSCGGA